MILPGFPVMIGGQGGFGQIPIGGILLYDTITPPEGGWELYYTSAMSSRALRGVGPGTAEKGTGGANQYTVTGETNFAGAHNGTPFWAYGNPTGASFPGTPGMRASPLSSEDTHAHNISQTFSHTPLSVRTPLIRKIGAPGLVPPGASILQGRPVLPSGFEEVAEYIGRVLRAANTAPSTLGAAYPSTRTLTTASAGAHTHGQPANTGDIDPWFGPDVYHNKAAGGHTHTITTAVDIRLRSVGLAQCRAVGAAQPVTPGMVIGYDGAGALPSGWRDANGSAGTVDMRDHYPILAELAQAGTVQGTGSILWTASSVSVAGAHSHTDGVWAGRVNGYQASHGDSQGGHTHTIPTRGGTVDATWYGIRFIQYLP